MIIKALVQNYYERYGTFDGIDKQSFADKLHAEAKNCKLDIITFCYQCLGYNPADISIKMSMDNYIAFRRAFLIRDMKTIKSIVGDISVEECQSVLKSVTGKTINLNKCNALKDRLTMTICNFLLLAPDCVVNTENGTQQFSIWLNDHLKEADDCNPINKVIASEGLDRDTIIAVYADTLFYNKNLLDEKTVIAALNSAIKITKYVKSFIKSRHIKMSELGILPEIDLKKYTYLLDVASVLGITYKELLMFYGCKVSDQIDAYNKTGFVFRICDDSVVYLNDNLGMHEGEIGTASINQFLTLLQLGIDMKSQNIELKQLEGF